MVYASQNKTTCNDKQTTNREFLKSYHAINCNATDQKIPHISVV